MKEDLMKTMFKLVIIIVFLQSCTGGLTPHQAASRPQKCGKGWMK